MQMLMNANYLNRDSKPGVKNPNKIYYSVLFMQGTDTVTLFTTEQVFNNLEINQAVAKYITKYITKELCTSTSGKKRFWCSRNVQKPIEQLYFLDGSNIDLLRHEMQEDHEHFKRVSYDICLSKASIEYYQNHGLTLTLEETE